MTNILYVHGYGSNKNSMTAKLIKQGCNEIGIQINMITFDVPKDPYKAWEEILLLCIKNQPELIIASSYGCFPCFMYLTTNHKPMIMINPCMDPYKDLQKIGEKDNDLLYSIRKFTDNLKITMTCREEVYGIFSSNDELFSYKQLFSWFFSENHITEIVDRHKISDNNIRKYIIPLIKTLIQ